jgi:hypothetical protein
LVTKVQSKVTPNSFDVSIRALHEGIEFGDQTLQPTSVVVNEPDRPEQPPPNIGGKPKEDPIDTTIPVVAPDPLDPVGLSGQPGAIK